VPGDCIDVALILWPRDEFDRTAYIRAHHQIAAGVPQIPGAYQIRGSDNLMNVPEHQRLELSIDQRRYR
jgi:hypothetical protein